MNKFLIRFLVVIIIAVSNVPIVSSLIDLYFLQNATYRYSNADGTYTREYRNEFKSEYCPKMQYLSIYKSYYDDREPDGEVLRRLYPNADTVIYRLFWKNPLCFWRWYSYITNQNERYVFPYKSWNTIIKRRPKKFLVDEGFQDF